MRVLFAAPESAWSGFLNHLEQKNPGHEFEALGSFNIQSLAGFDVVLPTMSKISREHLASADRLKLIQQVGAGTEGVDKEAAQELGIAVANVPSANTGNAESVAELGVFFMIALARNLHGLFRSVAQGVIGSPVGIGLKGKTVGIIGLGGIGQALIQRLAPFDVEIMGIRRHQPEAACQELGIGWSGGLEALPELLQRSDFVILAVPDVPATHGLMGFDNLRRMKPGAFLINLGRGGLIPRQDLLTALEEKTIAGAGLDVFWQEPPDPDDPIFQHNVIATPHIAGVTDVSANGIRDAVTENIRRLVAGEDLLNRLC